jgi:hypothetical protein
VGSKNRSVHPLTRLQLLTVPLFLNRLQQPSMSSGVAAGVATVGDGVPSVVEPVAAAHSNVHTLASAASGAPPPSTIVGGGEGGYGRAGAAGGDEGAGGLSGLYRGERKKDRWGLSGDTKMAASGSIYGNVEVSSDGIIGGGGGSKPSFLSRFGNIQLAGIDTFDRASPSPVPSAHTSASGGEASSPSPEAEVTFYTLDPTPWTLDPKPYVYTVCRQHLVPCSG